MRRMEVEVKQSKVVADSHTISAPIINASSVKLIMVIGMKTNLLLLLVFLVGFHKKIKLSNQEVLGTHTTYKQSKVKVISQKVS